MSSRRDFLKLLSATGFAPQFSACSGEDLAVYDEVTARLRTGLSANPNMVDFVRYAVLAANGHNTQPWRFMIRETGVSILPDMNGRTPAVDPDDHHLYVSLGCAAENFLVAAKMHGQPGNVVFHGAEDGEIEINLARGPAGSNDLYDAIPKRQSTRSEYDGRTVSSKDLRYLERAAAIDGVSVIIMTDDRRLNGVRDYVVAGNSAQMGDPAFVQELRDSIRFNPSEALRTGDGLFTACSGNPTLPSWVGKSLFSLFFQKDAENEKYAKQLASSAGVAVFIGDREDKDHWVRVGRSFQRFALQATALGILNSHVNQPIEVPTVRSEFASWLGAEGMRPDLVVRFGYGSPLPMSMRRPVDAVLV